MITATPTKIRKYNTWGARVTDPVSIGDTITIRTRSGKTWDAQVTEIVWGGSDACVVSTRSLDRPAPSRRPRRKQCVTGGNCSSFGDSRNCGGDDCDGF